MRENHFSCATGNLLIKLNVLRFLVFLHYILFCVIITLYFKAVRNYIPLGQR